MLTPRRRKRRREETAALSSQNISALGYPRGAEISRERGKEEEVRAVQLSVCVSSGTNSSLGFPSRRQCRFGGQLFVQPASPWNVQFSTTAAREMLKAMGRQCWESQALSQQFPGEDPLFLWCLLPWVGASSGLGPRCAWC